MGAWRTLDSENFLDAEYDPPTQTLLCIRCKRENIPSVELVLKRVKQIFNKSITYGQWIEINSGFLQAKVTSQITSKR